MIYGSVCSGIESASIAWEPLGMRPSWFSEVEAFPSAVLAHRWPHVANLGDMCNLPYLISEGLIEAPDILVGGTPCQAFSVAGARKGLEDERGQLTLKFAEIANDIDRKRPGDECVVVWENVPGALSSRDNAFGCFLGALVGEELPLQPAGRKWTNAGCVHGPERTVAWRVLDAQYFGVAQRRPRVFVVASAREGFNPSEVLFESEGVRRDSAPRRETQKETADDFGIGFEVAGTLDSRSGGFPGTGGACAGRVVPVQRGYRMEAFGQYADDETASTMKARDYKDATDLVTSIGGGIAHCLRGEGFDDSEDGSGRGTPIVPKNLSVRRLTPVECERLQGFPDNHTRIPWRNKPAEECPDGLRYKACGNSKAVPVVRWIGRRILEELKNDS